MGSPVGAVYCNGVPTAQDDAAIGQHLSAAPTDMPRQILQAGSSMADLIWLRFAAAAKPLVECHLWRGRGHDKRR